MMWVFTIYTFLFVKCRGNGNTEADSRILVAELRDIPNRVAPRLYISTNVSILRIPPEAFIFIRSPHGLS